jgi:hypothetical protein
LSNGRGHWPVGSERVVLDQTANEDDHPALGSSVLLIHLYLLLGNAPALALQLVHFLGTVWLPRLHRRPFCSRVCFLNIREAPGSIDIAEAEALAVLLACTFWGLSPNLRHSLLGCHRAGRRRRASWYSGRVPWESIRSANGWAGCWLVVWKEAEDLLSVLATGSSSPVECLPPRPRASLRPRPGGRPRLRGWMVALVLVSTRRDGWSTSNGSKHSIAELAVGLGLSI